MRTLCDEVTPRCTRCGAVKPLPDFALRSRARGSLQSWCRGCRSKYAAERYRRLTPAERAERRRACRERIAGLRNRLWDYLRNRQCVDCGSSDPVVYELDHVEEKIDNVADLVSRGLSWSTIFRELQKCEVRCANCHRRRTAERRADRGPSPIPTVRPSRGTARVPAVSIPDRACPRCRELLPASAFAWHRREHGSLQPWCKRCHNAHKRSVYKLARARHVALVTAHAKARAERNRILLGEYLAGRACVDCGETEQLVLEFDHQRDKSADVSTLIAAGRAWSTIAAELEKCEVRCANCHRKRTALQQGYAEKKRGLS